MIKLSQTNKKELSEIYNLLHKSWIDTYVPLSPYLSKENIDSMFSCFSDWEKTMTEALGSENFLSNTVSINGEIVGIIFGGVLNEVFFMRSFYIKSDHRGNGIGRFVLSKIKSKFTNIELEVLEINQNAQKFYMSNGFVKSDTYTYFVIDGRKFKNIQYEYKQT